MNALIVAAGLSSRLRPITENLPKSLIAIQGQSLIERSVSNLERLGINKIVVVVGYLREQITADMKEAMRARDTARLETVRLLRAAIQRREIDERIELDDDKILSVIGSSPITTPSAS